MSSQRHDPQEARNRCEVYPERNFGPGAKWIKSLTKDRTGQFTSGRYGSLDLTAVLYTAREDDINYVQLSVWSSLDCSKLSFDEAMKQEFRPARKGDYFGPTCTFSAIPWIPYNLTSAT